MGETIVWDRKIDGGIRAIKLLKQHDRDIVAPEKPLAGFG